MIHSLLFLLLSASGTLFSHTLAAPTPGYSSGLIYDVNTGLDTAPAPRALERRAGLVPHVSATNVVVSPNGGAYPRVTSLSDGTLLASYTAFSGSTRTLTVVRSTDGGNAFSAWGSIASGTGDLDNTFLLQLPNGNVVAAFRNHDLVNGKATYYRITACVSTDGGKTWKFLSQVAERAATATNNGLWVSCPCYGRWGYRSLSKTFARTSAARGVRAANLASSTPRTYTTTRGW